MNWNGVLRVSLFVGLVVYILQLLTSFFGWGNPLMITHIGLLFAGVLSTGFILSKKLPKEEWAILLGSLISVLLPFLIATLLDSFLGSMIYFRYN